MQDRREQRRPRDLERGRDVRRAARSARRDHRHVDARRDLGGERKVVAGTRPVGVDRREQDLARAALLRLARPVGGAARGRRRAGARPYLTALGVDRDDDRLRAQRLGELSDELGALERGRVDGHLVGTGAEQLVRIAHRAHAPADRERNREPLRNAPDQLDERGAFLERRLHVEEDELVGTRVRVSGAELDRIADVAELPEAHALDHAAAGHVEARDQTRERDLASSTTPAR